MLFVYGSGRLTFVSDQLSDANIRNIFLIIQILFLIFYQALENIFYMFDLKKFRKDKKISQKELAAVLSCQQSFVSQVENYKDPMPESWFKILADHYPLSSLEDYQVEEQDGNIMLVKEPLSSYELPSNVIPQGVPYYENIEGTCGIVTQFNDYKETPTFYIDYEHFNDCNAYIPVVGDSMYPQYCSGEIIAVKRIYNLDVIQWGEAYFVVANDNANSLRTVKLIYPHEDSDKIILRASNPNFKGDTVINKTDIISMFLIKGKIKRNQL